MNNPGGTAPPHTGATGTEGDDGIVILFVAGSEKAGQHAAELRRDPDRVIVEGTVAQALTRLSTADVDCVVSEYDLDDGTGIELLEAVRADHPALPFILWTEPDDGMIASDAVTADVTEYIPKRSPVSGYDELVTRVRHAVAEYRSRDAGGDTDEPRRLFSNVCRGLLGDGSREDKLHTVLEEVCQHTEWEYGEVWTSDDDRPRLTCAASYSTADRFDEFATITNSMTFEANEGLPGRVWASGTSEWIPDVSDLPTSRYLRTAPAAQIGLKTAFGVPVSGTASVRSVLVFYATERPHADRRAQSVVEGVAALLETYPEHRSARMELALEVTDAAIWEWDVETDSVTTYPDEHPVIGTGIETVDDFLERVHPDDRASVRDAIETAVETNTTYRVEFRVPHDGSVRRVEEYGEVRCGTDGTPSTVIGITKDVTGHREREQRLREEREQYSTFVENTSDGIAIVRDGEFGFVNERFADMHDTTRDDLIGESFLTDIDPEYRDRVQSRYERRLKGEDVPTRCEIGILDGKRTLEVSAARIEYDGRPADMWIVRDVTERTRRQRELDAARKRYRALIEAAPDPIFVADADTRRLVEVNSAAASLRKQSRDELVGLHVTELHPETDADRYRDLFDHHAEHGGSVREFDDGSPVYMMAADGERIPVSVSTATVSLDDRTLVHGIFRDISEQKHYENALQGINTAARDLLGTETDVEITRIAVDVATEILDSPVVGVYLYDGEQETLVPAASSDRLDALVGELPRLSPGEGIAWRVFTDQEPSQCEDVRTVDDVYNSGTPIRGELLYPLGEHGVLIVGDTEIGGVSDLDVELTEILAATVTAALDHADRTQSLRERERNAQLQAQRLERVKQLNEKIRTIITTVAQASTRDSIRGLICDSLCSLDRIRSAWIGERDHSTNELVTKATAGSPEQYLEELPRDVTPDATVPAVRAVRDRTTILEANLASQPHRDDWRNMALLHGIRSVVSVPLLHEDVLYGVLTIHSSQPKSFDQLTVDVLTELGEFIGYAINTVNQRNALIEDGTVGVTLKLAGANDVFVELATRLSTTVHIQNISTRTEDTFLVHFTADEVDPEAVHAVAEGMTGIRNVELIADATPPQFEATTIGECIATEVAELGARLRAITVVDDGCELRVSLPQDQDIETFVGYLEDRYQAVELTAQEDAGGTSRSWRGLLDDNLTDRQQEILTTAYHNGYFEQPRKRTGADIAGSLGISQPAFAKQLRVAQQKLLTAIYHEPTIYDES